MWVLRWFVLVAALQGCTESSSGNGGGGFRDVPGLSGAGMGGAAAGQAPLPNAGAAGLPNAGAAGLPNAGAAGLPNAGAAGLAGAPTAGAAAAGAAATGGTAGAPPVDAGVGALDAGVLPLVDAAPPPAVDAGTDSAVPDAGTSVSGIPAAELDMLRQVCVDEINMYRATLSLPPLERATPEQELCSDRGSQKDADIGPAHSSSGTGNPCSAGGWRDFPYFQAQNTCPGWGVGRFGGSIAEALRSCLASMWGEGEPPGGGDLCIQQYLAGDTACFLAHGHYLNMKGDSTGVSCGFYDMGNATYWMNQDFY